MIALRCWNCRAVLCRVPEDLDGFPVPSTLADPEARHLCGRCARDLREPEFDADALLPPVLAEDVEADDALAATRRSEVIALAKEGPLSSLARAGVLAAWEAARGGSREGAAELLRACEAYRAAAAMEARWDAVAVGRAS